MHTPFTRALQFLLASGETVRFTAPGHSMHPAIRHGDVLVVEPLAVAARTGDILLYLAGGRPVAHRLIGTESGSVGALLTLRGDAAFAPDLPVGPDQVIGRVIALERRGRRIDPYAAGRAFGLRLRATGVRIRTAMGRLLRGGRS